ncbi:MAG: hypothetical protein OXH29_00485 [bacterium]|nr:hypothetical protein [bacterium]
MTADTLPALRSVEAVLASSFDLPAEFQELAQYPIEFVPLTDAEAAIRSADKRLRDLEGTASKLLAWLRWHCTAPESGNPDRMTQTAYAEHVGVQQATISRYVNAWRLYASGECQSISEAHFRVKQGRAGKSLAEQVSPMIDSEARSKLSAWVQAADPLHMPPGEREQWLRDFEGLAEVAAAAVAKLGGRVIEGDIP